MKSNRKVRAGVGIAAIALLKKSKYRPATAIAEYVDNAIGSYLKEKKKLKQINNNYKLKIEIIKNGRELVIKDNAGGIGDNDYERAFELAEPPEDTSLLNEYGFGMKGASYWWTNKWSVKTKHYNESVGKIVSFDFKKIIRTKAETADVQEISMNNNKSFTIITLHKIDKPITDRVRGEIIDKLSSIHRFYINSEEIDIIYTDTEKDFREKLKYKKPDIKVIENIFELKQNIANKIQGKNFTKKIKKIKWEKKFNFSFYKNKYTCKAEVGILDKMKSDKSGFFYFRRGRLIEIDRPETIYRKGTGSAEYKSLYGIFHLDDVDVAMDKSELAWNDDEKERFEYEVLKVLRDPNFPILKMSDTAGSQIEEERDKLLGKESKKNRDPINDDISFFGSASLKSLFKKDKQNFKEYTKETLPKLDNNEKPNISKTKIGGVTYTCRHERNYSKTNVDPFLIFVEEKKKARNVELLIRISVYHPLIKIYMPTASNLVALELIATYIIISEIFSRDFQKTNKASDIRHNLNQILEDLPPTSIFKND